MADITITTYEPETAEETPAVETEVVEAAADSAAEVAAIESETEIAVAAIQAETAVELAEIAADVEKERQDWQARITALEAENSTLRADLSSTQLALELALSPPSPSESEGPEVTLDNPGEVVVETETVVEAPAEPAPKKKRLRWI